MTYTLINNDDCRDTIQLNLHEGDEPETVALDTLGWHIVAQQDDEDQLKLEL
jgi:hypothetical protein